MYDYRNDIINLINKTDNTPQSLMQTACALRVISNALINNASTPIKTHLKRPDKLLLSSTHNYTKTSQNASEIKAEPKTKKPIKQKKDPLSIALSNLKPDEYLAVDKLTGITIKDNQNNDITYFTESLKRDLGLENGDIVTLVHDISDDRYYLNTIVGHANLTKTIDYFKYGVIQRDALGLCVIQNVNRKQLSNSNPKKSRYAITSDDIMRLSLSEGDFVDLAWYHANPENISIIWKYNLNDKPNSPVIPKKHSEYKDKTESPKQVEPTLLFDLKDKRVALITADDSVSGKFDELVHAHSGKPTVIESNNGKNINDRLYNFDMIILLQNYLSHETTKSIIAKYKSVIPIAMSETAGQLNIEKALYRADKHLDIIDRDDIEYPTK